MTSTGDKNVYDQMKNRWINPLYREGIGRRTGRQLQVNAQRDSQGFENFSDYWSDSSTVESDISEVINKENNTNQDLTDGRGKQTGIFNRKMSSPLKPMQSFSSGRSSEPTTSTFPSVARNSPNSDTKSHSDQQPSGLDNLQEAREVDTETALSQDMESESETAGSYHLEGAPQDTAPESDLTESDNVEESNKDVETGHGDSSSYDTDPESGPSAKTVNNKKHTPVQDSINEADILGSIISLHTSQAPNSALQVFLPKKRLSFSINEPECSKTVKKKKIPVESKRKSPRKNNSNTTDETQSQAAESVKDKRTRKLSITKESVKQSQRQKRISTKTSSEDDSLDCTLTDASVDSDALTIEKGPVDEAGSEESSTFFETNKQTRRSRRSRVTTDNNERQSNRIENKRESRHKEEDHKESSEQEGSQRETDHRESSTQESQCEKNHKESSRQEERQQEKDHPKKDHPKKDHPKKENTRRPAKSCILSTEHLSNAFDDSANELKFLSLRKSHAKTLPYVDSGKAEEDELQDNDEDDEDDGNEIEIVEEAADTTNNEFIRTLKKTTIPQEKVRKGAKKKKVPTATLR